MASCSISAPASAEEGTVVSVSVTVVNTDTERRILRTTVTANEEQIIWVELPFASGQSMTFSGSFLMPAGDVTILAWISAYYEELDMWAPVASDGRVVSLAVPITFHLDVHVPPWAAGGGISPGSGDYSAYSTVMLTANPFSGYQFTGWGGDASGTNPTFSLYMDGDKYVEAYFEPVPVPEFAGSLTRKELDYDAVRVPFPVQ